MDALLWGVVVAYGFRVEAIKEYAKRNPAILYGALAVLLLFHGLGATISIHDRYRI
jgi:hypothetical protein